MNGYILDTDIVTEYLKKNPSAMHRVRQAVATGLPVMLNAVSYYETRRGLLYAGAQVQLAAFEQLCQALGVAMIDQAVLDKAAEVYASLRGTGRLIEDEDILIAAIALVRDMTLVTHNTEHFARIPDLRLEDWLIS